MNTATIDPTVSALLDVAALTLKFSRVPRATRHEDGIRAETDGDHTVMLTVLACAYAARYAPHLDVGKIAQFSSVHDLVEAQRSFPVGAVVRVTPERQAEGYPPFLRVLRVTPVLLPASILADTSDLQQVFVILCEAVAAPVGGKAIDRLAGKVS